MKLFDVFRLRFLVLQSVLAAGLVALYLQGYLMLLFIGDHRWFSIVVLSIGAFGLQYVWRRKMDYASWVAAMLMRIAVACMLISMIGALTAVSTSVLGGAETMKVTAIFLGNVGIAFYGSLCAVTSNLWLEVCMRYLGGGNDNEVD